MKNKCFTRREFIDRAAKGTIGLVGYSLLNNRFLNAADVTNTRSTVVVVKHDTASKIEYQGNKKLYNVDQQIAQVMMDEGICQLVGINDIGEAWKSFFPGITQSKVISIKLNCIARQDNALGLASHPEVIYSIVNGLTRMQVDGSPFPAENIIIWDRSEFEMERSGFVINNGNSGVKCYGTRYEIMRQGEDSGGYSTKISYSVAGVQQYLSKILVDETDYLINTCLLKDHVYSGVTLSLKNHYGTCWAPLKMHGGYCNPYIPALNALSPIKDKQVLCISDAIYAIRSGGPMGPPQITPNSIILSKDTVALDTVGYQILKENGTPNYTLSKARHVATAAQAPYNLGTNDLNQIDVINIDNPSTGINNDSKKKVNSDNFRLFQNYPNPFNAQTTISYQLFKPSRVNINIFNVHGALVRNLIDNYQTSGYYRIPWDGNNSNGIPVPSGTYLGRVLINDIQQTIRTSLIK